MPTFIKCLLWNLLAGVAVALVIAGAYGAETKVLRVGVFTPGLAFDPLLLGFREGLSRQGFNEGKSITFIVENTQGSFAALAPRMAHLLKANPDMIYAVTTAHAIAAKQATSTVPIVFGWVGDPIQTNLIAAYSSSKNNLTGVSTSSDSLSGKRLEALLHAAPNVKRVLAIVSPKEYVAQSSFRFLQEAAKKLGVHVVRREASSEEEIKQVLREIPKASVDAIYHIPSYLGSYIDLLIEKAKQDKVPLVVHEESMTEKGALLSYGPDFRAVGIQCGRLAAKVLKGETPADIPSETPEKLVLVVNLSTAKVIGLKVPREVLERADRLVE